ncbi:MAG: flagellar type III secretion system pore protein FliP [Rhodospirillaceae bacterium]|nr:flagellar type III secretion system pore protein FliP [Rhodospirillaceae bacterium]
MPRRAAGIAALFGLVLFLAMGPAMAQTFSLDLGDDAPGGTTGRIVQLLALMTVLSLAPGILITVTSFTRIAVVLSLLRAALGAQQTPPNMVLVSLALFLTAFVMAPTFQQAYDNGVAPLIAEEITEEQALPLVAEPFHTFMLSQVRDKDLELFMGMAQLDAVETPADTPFKVLIPAFMISELRRAFEIGFLVFLPFLIIDMVVASVLMSMGMMMLPPIMIALPFKLIFFVMVDGWYLVAGSLVRSFGTV